MSEQPVSSKAKTAAISVALPNGVIISLIGIFLFLTPFAAELEEPKHAIIDWIAGGCLLLFGAGLIVHGLRKLKASRH